MQSLASSDQRSLSRAVKQQAHCLGFSLAGITTPHPPPHLQAYTRWLEAGYHGSMAYLAEPRARQRRADPSLILPECRSILVLGAPYAIPPGLGTARSGKTQGQIAAYAWGADYHNVLPPRLQALTAWLENEVHGAIPARWYTDTGSLLERDLAQRAGLGWIGKNTCLIHPQKGSYFLLAEILLGIELEPDAPFDADRCGSCQRCLQACPTQCILPDRTLDARRCISYLTIENKGPIPPELRPLIGDWIFGCDVCQQVCPWNQRFGAADLDFAAADRSTAGLLDLLALTPQDFNQRFKATPVQRARRRGFLRNVCVALGNTARGTADPQVVRALAQSIQDPEALVGQHAAWALGQVGGQAARQLLADAAARELDSTVQAEIQAALR
ncbi:MAG: tRNA epoxyqueuosine(34) reductase QueG [Anaerolineales bacterium]|jgi:epoxyqueuosine reductase|nr:tRNA epoxyqueuosine(34) reductase QueG [Anaerolineales bacterium]